MGLTGPASRMSATSAHRRGRRAQKPTIKAVAKRASVSLKTVSRVINHGQGVRERTCAKVLKAVADLGYQPDVSARSLRGSRAYAMGLVYDDPNPYYVISVQSGGLSVCRVRGY